MMSLQGFTVLVTGGAGFIGSHIVEDLVTASARVKVYDNFSFGLRDNLRPIAKHVEIIEGDILDCATLERAMRNVDFVSHQAAQLEIFRSTDDPLVDLQINTVGTLNVLKAAKRSGVRKVVNASSACIYGQVNGPTSEDHLPVPNWAYGVSKLAAERYARIYNDYQKLPVVNLRYGIVYGEREWYRRVLTLFIKRAVDGKPPVVFGDGLQVRDFIYVGDVVRLHRLCLGNPNANGQSYNVGTARATTIQELARLVVDASGLGLQVLQEDVAEGAYSQLVPDKRRNSAELKMMLLDCSKAKRELGWEPQVTLLEGVRREIEWVRHNLARWQRIHYSEVV